MILMIVGVMCLLITMIFAWFHSAMWCIIFGILSCICVYIGIFNELNN